MVCTDGTHQDLGDKSLGLFVKNLLDKVGVRVPTLSDRLDEKERELSTSVYLPLIPACGQCDQRSQAPATIDWSHNNLKFLWSGIPLH